MSHSLTCQRESLRKSTNPYAQSLGRTYPVETVYSRVRYRLLGRLYGSGGSVHLAFPGSLSSCARIFDDLVAALDQPSVLCDLREQIRKAVAASTGRR